MSGPRFFAQFAGGPSATDAPHAALSNEGMQLKPGAQRRPAKRVARGRNL